MSRKSILSLPPAKFRLSDLSVMALVLSAGAALMPTIARGDIYATSYPSGTVGEYTTSGTTVNPTLISGLNYPYGIAASGSDLFVANYGHDGTGSTVGEYTTSGATVNPSFISGLTAPFAITVSGSDLFVANETINNSWISEYTTSGAIVNPVLISGLSYPFAMVVSGPDIFVANQYTGVLGPGSISEYTTDGATVNASLVSGLSEPNGLAVSGSDLYVANGDYSDSSGGSIGEYTLGSSPGTISSSIPLLVSGLNEPIALTMSGSDLFVANYLGNTIGEYTTSGTTVNASLVSGLNDPNGIVVVDVPESAMGSLLLVGCAAVLIRRRTGNVRKAVHNPAEDMARMV